MYCVLPGKAAAETVFHGQCIFLTVRLSPRLAAASAVATTQSFCSLLNTGGLFASQWDFAFNVNKRKNSAKYYLFIIWVLDFSLSQSAQITHGWCSDTCQYLQAKSGKCTIWIYHQFSFSVLPSAPFLQNMYTLDLINAASLYFAEFYFERKWTETVTRWE